MKKLITNKEITNELKKRIENIELSYNNFNLILRHILEVVELTKTSGENKKEKAIYLIKQVIDKSNINNKEKKIYYEIIDNNIISNIIDLIVLASKNKIKINKKKLKIRKLSKKISSKFRKASIIQSRYSDRRRSKEKSIII
tara:strand:- start:1911 stop:2336 length:426 start_codon:yes stop_codon:yes gene_type:complete